MQNANSASVPASPQQQQQQQPPPPPNHGNPNVHVPNVHPSNVMQSGQYFHPQGPYYNNGPYNMQQNMSPAMYYQNQGPIPHQQTPQSQTSQSTSGQQTQQQAQSAMSPSTSRKRRASEVDEGTLPPSMAMSPYTMAPHQTLMTPQQSTSAPAPSAPTMVANAPQAPMKVETSNQGPQPSAETDSPSQDGKKGRTNTPWTPQEEGRLKTMRDEGASWNAIAKTFPQRTEGSVKKHWYKDMHFENVSKVDEGNFVCLSPE